MNRTDNKSNNIINTFLSLVLLLGLPAQPIAAEEETAGDQEAATEEEQAFELPAMEVIDVTPIAGGALPIDKIPANTQTVTSEDLKRAQSLSLGEYMNRNLMSVNINEAQNNPLQPNVRFRGFTASPLLGTPQGLSIYLNGIRFNEPFGDTVNWELIPPSVIEQMVLHPGSNPLYGLNTLGGAISIRTKTGFSAPGHQLKVYGGSWDRHDEELSSAWNNGTFGYFIDLRNFGEAGWRNFSGSKLNQGFGTFSWRGDEASLDLTLAGTGSDLNGNGALPIQLYELSPTAVFTHPDNTRNSLFFASLNGSAAVTDLIELAGNAYFRHNDTKTFNGDDSDFEECEEEELEGFVCEEEGDEEELVFNLQGEPIEATDRVLGGTQNLSKTQQDGWGGNLQSIFAHDVLGMQNQFILGGSFDYAKINFNFDTELASLTSTRGTIGGGVLVEEARVILKSRTRAWGIFLTDTLSVTDGLSITLSGRYNNSNINMEDRFGDELNGDHSFERFNPAAGFTYTFTPAFSFYGGYNESSRAPTPVELSCADPEAPCKLPNAFLSDPPLKQVVAKTFEIGWRGQIEPLFGGYLDWNAALYQTHNYNDIQFISAGNLTNEGFFTNVGTTRRQGAEVGMISEFDDLIGDFDHWRFAANYSYIDAVFRTPFIASSPNNPSANEDGDILVTRGSRLPGIPEHMVKLSADVDLWSRMSMGLDMVYNSSQVFRGDEANLNPTLPGFVVFNLRTEYRFNDYIALFGKVDNLFNKRFETFALYGEADEVLGDAFNDPRFVSPGAARAGWIGFRLSLL